MSVQRLVLVLVGEDPLSLRAVRDAAGQRLRLLPLLLVDGGEGVEQSGIKNKLYIEICQIVILNKNLILFIILIHVLADFCFVPD